MPSFISALLGISLILSTHTAAYRQAAVPSGNTGDLVFSVVDASKPGNGFEFLKPFTKNIITQSEKDTLKAFVSNPQSNLESVKKILAKYKTQIEVLKKISDAPYFQDTNFVDPSKIDPLATPKYLIALSELNLLNAASVIVDTQAGKTVSAISSVKSGLGAHAKILSSYNSILTYAMFVKPGDELLSSIVYLLDSGKLNNSKYQEIVAGLDKAKPTGYWKVIQVNYASVLQSVKGEKSEAVKKDIQLYEAFLLNARSSIEQGICNQASYDKLDVLKNNKDVTNQEWWGAHNIIFEIFKNTCHRTDVLSLLKVKAGIILAKKNKKQFSSSLVELREYIGELPKSAFDASAIKYVEKTGIVYTIGSDLRDAGGSSKTDGSDELEPTYKIAK